MRQNLYAHISRAAPDATTYAGTDVIVQPATTAAETRAAGFYRSVPAIGAFVVYDGNITAAGDSAY